MKAVKTKAVKRQNFTIVEILVVCVIISILSALGVAGYNYAQYKVKESKTQALITRISTAIKACKEKHGFYPPSNDNYLLFKDLELSSETDTDSLKYKFFNDYANMVGYSNFGEHITTIDTDENVVIDAFGYPLYYRCPGLININSFDLYSAGKDGLIGDPDDKIELWEGYKPFQTNSSAEKADSDDLVKFDTKNFDDLGNDI